MRDEDKTKEELINELIELRQQNIEMKKYIIDLEKIQRCSEKAITITEEKYNNILKNPIVGVYRTLPEGLFMVNDAFADIFGYNSPEELMSSLTYKEQQFYVNPDDRVMYIQQVLEHGFGSFEIQVYRKDRSKAWISNYASVVRNNNRNIICFEGIVIDITQRKQAEEELNKYRQHLEEIVAERTAELRTAVALLQQETVERKQVELRIKLKEKKFRKIFLHSPIGIELYDKNGLLLDANKACLDMFGLSNIDDIKELNLFENPHLSEEAKKKIINGEQTRYEITYNFDVIRAKNLYKTTKSGFIYIDVFITPFGKEGHVYQGYLVQVQEITQRKLVERELRLSEERFSKAFNASPIAMAIYSLDTGKFIDVNENYLKMHGYSRDECIGRSVLDLNIWVDMDERTKFLRDIKRKGNAHNHEVRCYKKSGGIIIALSSGVVIKLNGEQCVLVIKSDITELRQYQKELTRLANLNLIGEMAAGIAHEIRNPMTTVRGFLQMLGSKKEYNQSKEYFNLMIQELDRANSIITEFLTLAKNKPIDLKIQNLNNIIKNISPLIAADSIVVDKYLELELSELPSIPLDESEIRQLILNLVRNGLDAISSGEYLTIKTYSDGSEVILVVKDCGKGIPSDILDKIGTPFFTTKENGTGLGLATCYSIANRHNANIDFDTGTEGTTFYVRFKVNYTELWMVKD